MLGVILICLQRQAFVMPVDKIVAGVVAEADGINPVTYRAASKGGAVLVFSVPVPLFAKAGDHAAVGLN